MVIAGPGTGKTELLSMRAANILKKTDALPENILCLTFTDSGANAMRARLASIIGPSAYKVAIQTFHGFGTEIINQYREYFYRGAEFQPAAVGFHKFVHDRQAEPGARSLLIQAGSALEDHLVLVRRQTRPVILNDQDHTPRV